jgi:hypothetical protein
MKKLKISMLALVFTVGIGTAIVQKIDAAPKRSDPTYNWTSSQGPQSNLTVQQAKDHYGCQFENTGCARGALSSGSGPAIVTLSQN